MTAVKGKPNIVLVAVLLLLIAGAGLLYWLFFLKPAITGIGELREANSALEQDIDALKQKLSQKSEVEGIWKDISGQEEKLRTKIPQTADLPRVLGALENLILSSGLNLDALSVSELQEGEGYRFIPVSLRMSGAEAELLKLLEQLEKFTHKTLTERVTIERGDELYRMSLDFVLVFITEG